MRDAYILGFRYRYVDENGKSQGFIRQTGSVTRDGISLHDQRIFIRDVYRVQRHNDILVISLKPYATLSKEISEAIVPRHNALVIDVDEMLAEKVKSVIDRQCTAMHARDNWGHLSKDQRDKQFQRIECPRCDSIIDLTNLVPSPLVHCKHCEATFDKFGYLLPGSEDYKICPECNHYGRVQDNTEFKAYTLYKDTAFSAKRTQCCDTCAHRMFLRNVWKNLTLIFGFFVSIFFKLNSRRNRNPLYKGLQEANYHAQNGNMVEADIIFTDLILRNDRHPGIYYNYGLAFLNAGERDRAAFQFKKSLDVCSNYAPTLEILKKNVDLQTLAGEAE